MTYFNHLEYGAGLKQLLHIYRNYEIITCYQILEPIPDPHLDSQKIRISKI